MANEWRASRSEEKGGREKNFFFLFFSFFFFCFHTCNFLFSSLPLTTTCLIPLLVFCLSLFFFFSR